MKRFVLIFIGLLALALRVNATPLPMPTMLPPSIVTSSFTATAGTATVTITTPTSVGPYSAGQYTYISHIHIEMYAGATLTGGAIPVTCTTTNLGGTVFKLPSAAATGTVIVLDMPFDNPIQGLQGSNVAISCPGQPSTIWNVIVNYFQGS